MSIYELSSSGVRVHTHACGEGGIFVNAYLVETPTAVIAIDATLTESESRALRTRLDRIGKPLAAVLVTHCHPDHVAGITNLVAGLHPEIIATAECADIMRRTEARKREQWTPVFGAEWVRSWTYPNFLARSGERFILGGATFSLLDVGAGGDAESNAVWFLEAAPSVRTAFLGDVVFNGPHSYIADGYLLAWLANLTRLEELCRGMARVFPGHGPSDAPHVLLDRQRNYLLTFAAHVKELADGKPTLSEAAKGELERRMQERYPEAGLSFLIAMSADPVARELSRSTGANAGSG